MEGLRAQPDLHDLLRMEDDVISPTSMDLSPERPQNSLNNSASKINTPAKLMMVGEPILVKKDHPENNVKDLAGDNENKAETSGSSAEELADRINTPSPETAAAMESLIAEDDLLSASPKLDVSEKPSAPVCFTTTATSKLVIRPQTSAISSVKLQQPISIAAKKIMVASQPVQVVRKDGGGPIVTKFLVKRTTPASAATQKSPVVFTKTKGIVASPNKTNNLKSGSIVLSPIKGGFKIPISPIKSPIKVSVIPPSNTNKKLSTLGKPITVPIQTSLPPTPQQKVQTSTNALMVNGVIGQGNKTFIAQQPLSLPNRQITINTNPSQVNSNQRQVVQQLNVIPNSTSIQDNQNMKIQYVQLQLPQNNTLQQTATIRSNQGQPITFTSMAQLNGGSLPMNPSANTIAFIPPTLSKMQPSQSSNMQRKAQTVKVAIPSQSTHQVKSQRLIMPATSLHQNRNIISTNTPGAVQTGNFGYAMVPAKYVEQLQKHIISQSSFVPDATTNTVPKPVTGKIGANGKLKKPCNCTKSQCLKLYCECFANGQFCDECNCVNCFNNLEHEAERSKAVKQCLERNPSAFRPKIGRGKDDSRTHQKGCNCKRSGCLKNYCECYEARIPCTSKCKCIGCKNYEETNDRRSLMSLADAADFRVQQQTAAKTKLSNQIGEVRPTARTTQTGERLPYTFFTQEAEEAEKTNRSMVVAEAMILEEFGRCVMQIIQSAGKAKVIHFN